MASLEDGVTLDLLSSLDTLCECDTPVEAVGRAESERGTVTDQTTEVTEQGYDITMEGELNIDCIVVATTTTLCALLIGL